MKSFIINENDSGQRVDKFLSKAVPDLPQNLMYKYLRTKRIKLNRKKCEISTRLCKDDVLELYINDEFFADRRADYDFLSAPDKIDAVYEDENIILIDKKPGLVVHEDESGVTDTLINRLLHYLYEKKEYDPDLENSFVPSLCNRIDRNTGGIVIAAKNAASLRVMNQKIKDRELHKKYLCICVGRPPKNTDKMTAYLFKDSKTNTVYVSDRKTKENRTIITEYKVLETKGELSLLEITLHTGRTHQIRAHMAYIGCPLLGDGKYGINKINKKYGVKSQILYSYKLEFDFTTDADVLEYLNHRTFSTDIREKIWKETER